MRCSKKLRLLIRGMLLIRNPLTCQVRKLNPSYLDLEEWAGQPGFKWPRPLDLISFPGSANPWKDFLQEPGSHQRRPVRERPACLLNSLKLWPIF
ncbi:MAG TPA: hypothetical protein VNE41_08145 [Chitinophagaceae bacterium]|nr:hypothetical protein [Chitinophagaceae bacterium]